MTIDLVADLDDVLDARHAVVGQLADADEAFLAGHDLDEGAEVDRAGDAAGVDLADLTASCVRPSIIAMARRAFSSLVEPTKIEPSSSTSTVHFVSSMIERTILPPGPMTTPIFSRGIWMRYMRGA